jgi:ABC-type phosphate transport system auxiliary subunit
MSDSGEGLVDVSTRLAERMDELEDERRQAKKGAKRADPVKTAAIESLRLAEADLRRQLAAVSHEARRQQLALALAEIQRRLADIEQTA